MTSAVAEETPVIRNRPQKLSKVSGFTLFELSSDVNVDRLLNHAFSIMVSFPSCLSFAIALDNSETNREPLGKT